ncbi:MAG TPA: phospholipase D family protein [Pseudogracilibacillus sp.]|nr:phospholipase D family protein [Pseudogracilibacillus sp.]
MQKFYKKKSLWILLILLLIIVGIVILNKTKPIPKGLSYESDVYQTDKVEFLSDLTYYDNKDEMKTEQDIFKEVINVINQAEDFVVVDMFLFNDFTDQNRNFPDLSGKLTKALIAQKEKHPELQVVFITDPVNTGYGSYEDRHLEDLEKNDIEVVITSLSELRDSNSFYSAAWRLFFQPFGNEGTGWLPNPLAKEGPKITVRSYAKLFNVKANHRKAVASEKNAIIASANPHNESGFASNIAFKVSGEIINDIVKAEQAVIDYSGGEMVIDYKDKVETTSGDIAIQYLTEGKILKSILEEIEQAKKDDTIWIGMFYIANRDVIDAIHDATDRGAKVQLILDPNKNAFGSNKTGLPNMPIASEMVKDNNLDIRWYEAKEDQYHTKIIYIKKPTESVVIGGSANYTTRNLDDLNLENNLKITAPQDADVMQDVDAYFNRLWDNEDGTFTSDYETNEDSLTSALKLTYWLQKLTGLTTY